MPPASERASEAASWPQRLLERQRPAELISDQTINPATGLDYALISRTSTPMRGPYVLECIDLRTGSVRQGPVFRAGNLTAVSGYLWVYGNPRPGARPVLSQVSPATLEPIRPILVPPGPGSLGWPVLAAGPDKTVWIGFSHTLRRVNVSTGTAVMQLTLPPGLAVSHISMDPTHKILYVSAAHAARDGGDWGLVMLEYDAQSGRLLAMASGGLLRYSIAGAALTGVPGGVWVSFGTGMMGLTIHLRRADLRMIAPPGPGITRQPANGLFHWAMNATTLYRGGALWLANLRFVACLDPRTGQVRASERLSQSPSQALYRLQAIDPAARAIYGLSGDGVLQISPPRRCWS